MAQARQKLIELEEKEGTGETPETPEKQALQNQISELVSIKKPEVNTSEVYQRYVEKKMKEYEEKKKKDIEETYEDVRTLLPPKNTAQIAEQKKIAEVLPELKRRLKSNKYSTNSQERELESLEEDKRILENESPLDINGLKEINESIEQKKRNIEIQKKAKEIVEQAINNPELIQKYYKEVENNYNINKQKLKEEKKTIKTQIDELSQNTNLSKKEKKAKKTDLEQELFNIDRKLSANLPITPQSVIREYASILIEKEKEMETEQERKRKNQPVDLREGLQGESVYGTVGESNPGSASIYGTKPTNVPTEPNTYNSLNKPATAAAPEYAAVDYAKMDPIRKSNASIYSTIEGEGEESHYVDLDEVKNNTGESEYSNLTFAPERPYNVEYPVDKNIYGDSDVNLNTGYLKIGVNNNASASGGGNMIHKNLKYRNLKSRNLKSRKVKSKKYKIFKNSKKYKI